MPSRLFRYRECSERQFDAFYNDKVYAVNAQMFNDPYDCLIRYDKKYLYSTIEAGASKELIKQLRDRLRKGEPFPEFLASLYGEELTKLLKDVICNITDEELNKKKSTFGLNKKELFKYVEIELAEMVLPLFSMMYFTTRSNRSCLLIRWRFTISRETTV